MISASYSKLARIYDRIMAHVNYPEWAKYISNLLQYSTIKIDNMIDISCGTGKHLENINLKKVRLFGSDVSQEMLYEAKKNLSAKPVSFISQDVFNVAIKENCFEAAIMLYDSVNYLFTEQEVIKVFNEIDRILKPNGIFIFDIVTEEGLRESFDDYYESDSWEGIAYERHSSYSFKDNIQTNKFVMLFNGKSYMEIHKQKIRKIKEWRKLIAKSNMKLSREFSNFSQSPASEKSERVHFVCHSMSI